MGNLDALFYYLHQNNERSRMEIRLRYIQYPMKNRCKITAMGY
jgi:hypothetical protein